MTQPDSGADERAGRLTADMHPLNQADPSQAALADARLWLSSRPDLAAGQAEAVLKTSPGHVEALLILGAAYRQQGQLIEALALHKPLVRTRPDDAEAQFEWAATQAAMGLVQPAIDSLRHATRLGPQHPSAWRLLGSLLHRQGEPAQADAAFQQQVRHALRDPVLAEVARAVDADNMEGAERALRARLAQVPDDVAARRMLADIRLHHRDYAGAEALAARCLSLAPSLTPARLTLAAALLYQGQTVAARPQVERLLADYPGDPRVQVIHASYLAMTGAPPGAGAGEPPRRRATAPGRSISTAPCCARIRTSRTPGFG